MTLQTIETETYTITTTANRQTDRQILHMHVPMQIHITQTHTQKQNKAFGLLLSCHTYPVSSTGAAVHYSATMSHLWQILLVHACVSV